MYEAEGLFRLRRGEMVSKAVLGGSLYADTSVKTEIVSFFLSLCLQCVHLGGLLHHRQQTFLLLLSGFALVDIGSLSSLALVDLTKTQLGEWQVFREVVKCRCFFFSSPFVKKWWFFGEVVQGWSPE